MNLKTRLLKRALRISKKRFNAISAPAPEPLTLELALSRVKTFRKAVEGSEFFARFFIKMPAGVQLDPILQGGVNVTKATPTKKNHKAILYLHGGAWFLPLIYAQKVFAALLAQVTGATVFAVDYRLAPEHPYPAALNDALAVYNSLIDDGFDPQQIIFLGDSAGGNLILALLLKLKQDGRPLPGAAIALSPVTDLNFSGESILRNVEIDPILSIGDRRVIQFMYARDATLDNPLVSPLLGDLSGLPPTLILVGGQEILYSDSVNFADKAKAAGVDVALDVSEEMFHVYPVFYYVLDEAKMAMGKIALFIKMKTG